MAVDTGVRRQRSLRVRLGRALGAAAVILVVWFVVGMWSAPGIARAHFLATYRDGAGGWSGNVVVESVSPAIPPFFEVRVSGVVGHGDWYGYMNRRSQMVLWVEPVTGSVIRWTAAEPQTGFHLPGI